MKKLIMIAAMLLLSIQMFADIDDELRFLREQREERQHNTFINVALGIVIPLGIWLAIRPVVLWYYKINNRLEEQEINNQLLKEIRVILLKQSGADLDEMNTISEEENNYKLQALIDSLQEKQTLNEKFEEKKGENLENPK